MGSAALLPVAVAALGVLTACAPPPAAADGWASLLPQPTSVTRGDSAFTFGADARISVSPANAGLEAIADLLAGTLRPSTGFVFPVAAGDARAAIRLALDPTLTELGDEGYTLAVEETGIEIRAATPAGVFYGTQTLRQLLPAQVEEGTAQVGPWSVATGTVHDVPRFAWRGLMVDVARHFFGPADLRRYVEVMAQYKLNRLHLHLTDDQGWRIQIDAWPELTTVGAASAVGGGPGGFLTRADYAELVAYAAARFITVVPEVDVPGHTHAALASIPGLNCNGVAPAPYTGTEVGKSSLCPGLPATDAFLQDVIGELAAMTPGPWLHLGGDEAKMTSASDYQSLMARVRELVRANGKQLMGWEELSRAGAGTDEVVQEWLDPDLAAAAVARGAKVVLSPARRAYLDMQYELGVPEGVGTFWAGFLSVPGAYDWDPGTWISNVPEASVLGVEAPVWTETIATRAQLDSMVFPRLLGLAELGWSSAGSRGVSDYLQRLGAHGPRLRAWGIGYYAAPQVKWK